MFLTRQCGVFIAQDPKWFGIQKLASLLMDLLGLICLCDRDGMAHPNIPNQEALIVVDHTKVLDHGTSGAINCNSNISVADRWLWIKLGVSPRCGRERHGKTKDCQSVCGFRASLD